MREDSIRDAVGRGTDVLSQEGSQLLNGKGTNFAGFDEWSRIAKDVAGVGRGKQWLIPLVDIVNRSALQKIRYMREIGPKRVVDDQPKLVIAELNVKIVYSLERDGRLERQTLLIGH